MYRFGIIIRIPVLGMQGRPIVIQALAYAVKVYSAWKGSPGHGSCRNEHGIVLGMKVPALPSRENFKQPAARESRLGIPIFRDRELFASKRIVS